MDTNIVVAESNILNSDITVYEVHNVLLNAKKGKAVGSDKIPVEVLCNDLALEFLVCLFQKCFTTGLIPSEWSNGLISPIPKSSTSDPRDPLMYRGITLTSCVYKLFCGVLNNRLQSWSDVHGKIADEQNGFRPGRSTLDQLFSVSTIVETRKLRKMSTFIAFIDFRKAYDRIPRKRLLYKLKSMGIQGNMIHVLDAIYKDTQCCVRLNRKIYTLV
jgi:hypothetical protein